ncbi:hypothetical protein [uncultured Chryseobacterium sp.]|uniref:hypothetical protein n=1 Tax=uncultured Chryseobacterium sp. TaxID=259322 RepID=UPI0025CF4E11|nr:hypothetical protein [uncultured Chryseobacterium sp.]
MGRKLLLIGLYLYALMFSVARTLRLPNKWSESHWMMDYRFGFIKRGLAGEIFGWFCKKDEFSILILSAVILLLLFVFMIGIAFKETIKRENSFYRILFFLIFFLSQYIVFSAHLIGYLDHVVFLLTLAVIYLIGKNKVLPASLIATFSVFIHEISLFLMLPVSVFALFVFQNARVPFLFKSIFSKEIIRKMTLFLIFPFLAIAFISFFHEHDGTDYAGVVFNYLKGLPFIPEKVAQSVTSGYTQSFSLSFQEQHEYFIQRVFISKATIFYGIPMLFLLWMTFREFNLKANIGVFILLAIVAFIPLLLHSIAYDTYRIWTFPFMILFLGFWVLSSAYQIKNTKVKRLSVWEKVFFMISVLLVTLIPNVLFDNETERFSLPVKISLILPLFLMLYLLKKPRSKQV